MATPDHEHDEDGYDGPAVLEIAGQVFALRVRLAGYFQPLDGRYHWYGRIEADPGLTAAAGQGRSTAALDTPHGRAVGSVGDPDLWHRYRIEGEGAPPFPIPLAVREFDER